MRLRSANVALLLLVMGYVALSITAYASYRSLQKVVSHGESSGRALQTQLALERIRSLMVDVETGQRGFVFTGEEDFLDPYRSARQALNKIHRELNALLVADDNNSFDLAPLRSLDDLIAKRLAHSEFVIEQRRLRGDGALKDLDSYLVGKRLTDAIGTELAQLQLAQGGAVEQHVHEVNLIQQAAQRQALILTLAAAVFVAFAVSQLWIERMRRDRSERALRKINTTLEQQVAARTRELRSALERIQSFTAELDRNVEAERRRLAREVHDQFGQVAMAIKTHAVNLRQVQPPIEESRIARLIELVDEAIATARRMASELRPPLLDDLGLSAAVHHLVTAVEQQGGLQCEVEIKDDQSLNPHQARQLFRIVQEAVTNVLRHAHAQHLSMYARTCAGSYCLTIMDDGQGPGPPRPGSHGLRNMRERAALAGGSLQFGPGDEGGTRVSVMLPVASSMEASR